MVVVQAVQWGLWVQDNLNRLGEDLEEKGRRSVNSEFSRDVMCKFGSVNFTLLWVDFANLYLFSITNALLFYHHLCPWFLINLPWDPIWNHQYCLDVINATGLGWNKLIIIWSDLSTVWWWDIPGMAVFGPSFASHQSLNLVHSSPPSLCRWNKTIMRLQQKLDTNIYAKETGTSLCTKILSSLTSQETCKKSYLIVFSLFYVSKHFDIYL